MLSVLGHNCTSCWIASKKVSLGTIALYCTFCGIASKYGHGMYLMTSKATCIPKCIRVSSNAMIMYQRCMTFDNPRYTTLMWSGSVGHIEVYCVAQCVEIVSGAPPPLYHSVWRLSHWSNVPWAVQCSVHVYIDYKLLWSKALGCVVCVTVWVWAIVWGYSRDCVRIWLMYKNVQYLANKLLWSCFHL